MKQLLLKYLFEKSGMKQVELADRACVCAETISAMLHGRQRGLTATRQKVADALGWDGDPMMLYCEVDIPEEPTTGQYIDEDLKRAYLEVLVEKERNGLDPWFAQGFRVAVLCLGDDKEWGLSEVLDTWINDYFKEQTACEHTQIDKEQACQTR